MKNFFKIFAPIIAVSILFAQNQDKEVIAKVNDYNITKKELDIQVQLLIPRNFIHSNVSDEKRKELEKEALKDLINKRVLLDYAKKRGYKVSKKELKKAEKRFIKAYGNKDNLKRRLKISNMSYEEFLKGLKEDLLIRKLYDKEVKREFSEKELKEYYEKNRYKFKMPPKLKLRLIYLRNDPTDPKGRQKALKRAKEVMEKLKKGEDFSELARKYSNDMTRIKGGDMGFIHQGMLEEPIEKEAMKLKEGEISEPIETIKGFYIIKLEKRTPEKLFAFDEIKEKLKRELKAKEEKKRMEEILKRAKKESKIEVYAKNR